MNAFIKGDSCGTQKSEREDGRVYMHVDTDQDTGGTVESGVLTSAKHETIAELRESLAYLGAPTGDPIRGRRPSDELQALASRKEFSATARKVGGSSFDVRPTDLDHEG